ncbi:hypothetical protein BDY19DRAFT_139651 [Irpex rosettiformis]|uniref:Uncharacterized protein n=1 Tax=Irpex rosettiformis TaxID=378272 RepID=A0ACB8U4N9_9APHY|nr:hypothetical protein BDY19DRAFT_139651 [Irpex rosettiformis]
MSLSATSLAPLRGTPPPPLAQSSPYSHNYPSTSSTLIQHDASTGLSIAGYNTSQGRVQDSSSVTPTSAIAQQPYPNHYLSANAQSVPSPHHYTPHGTPSQSRQSSPPVVLAPIQSDRLPRGAPPRDMLSHGGSAHQQPLSAQQQSQHSALSVNRVSATQGHHHVGLATSYPSHMHQSQHPQHPHGGQTQYPYSTYSTLSANQDQHQAHNNNSHHDNWRTTADHYHTGRAALSHSHSMSSTGLAV